MEILQRSPEWFKLRLGRFTASNIDSLLGIKGLGLTGESLAFDKSVELFIGEDNDDGFESIDMRRGIELEPFAFAKFKELKAIDFVEVKECAFFPYGEDAGASPDGLVGDDAVLEIKCPRANKFFRLVSDGKIEKIYQSQMQAQMLATNAKRCHFFNYIIFNGKEYWHEIIVERDETIIALIKARIIEATKIRNGFVEYLNNNKQF